MSFFGVTRETISSVKHHFNADRLDVCTLTGLTFEFVTGRDQYEIGDEVIYFPIDAKLPIDLALKMGIKADPNKEFHRVRTVRLRKQLSQGFVYPMATGLIPDDLHDDIASYLGVTKYEPEVAMCQYGSLHPLPDTLSVYDIEGAERNKSVIDEHFLNHDVVVTEKIEGTNFSVLVTQDGELKVNQRRRTIIEEGEGENTYWKMARDLDFIDIAKEMLGSGYYSVCIYGELIGPGIQGNYYRLKEHIVKVFDVKYSCPTSTKWLSHRDISVWFADVVMAPVLFTGALHQWLDGKTVVEASNGRSQLVDRLREGVVIKRVNQTNIPAFGRPIIKQRDPIYLGKTGN